MGKEEKSVKKRENGNFAQKEDTPDSVLQENGRNARKTDITGNEKSKKVRKKF